MKKKRWLTAVAAVALIVLFLGWCLGWFEPRHGGMRASAYVFQELNTPRFGTSIAAEKLKPMGAKLALPALLKALTYEDSAMRLRYAKLHAQSPKPLKKLLPAPRSVQHLRRNAITALNVFGPDASPAVPMLIRLYTKADAFQRQSIASALGSIGPPARAAVSALLNDLTNSSSQRFPFGAITALGKIDLSGELTAHEIIPFANTWDPSTSMAALNALGNMSRTTPALATNLWSSVRHGLPTVRPTALRNLDDLGLLTRDALDSFFLELTNREETVRWAALSVVTFSTNFAAELVPVLCRLARDDPEPDVRSQALGSLLRYGARTNVSPQLREDALFLVMTRGTNEPSWSAMDAVRGLAPRGGALVPPLIPLLTNAEPRLRGKAAEALAQLGPAASNAAPQLRPLLNDEWSYVREAATNALRASGHTP